MRVRLELLPESGQTAASWRGEDTMSVGEKIVKKAVEEATESAAEKAVEKQTKKAIKKAIFKK